MKKNALRYTSMVTTNDSVDKLIKGDLGLDAVRNDETTNGIFSTAALV